jgi:rhodanese-related sulfurtransferase
MQDIVLFMQHHGTLTMAFAIVLLLLIIIEFIRLRRGTNQISPAELTTLINRQNAVIVDLRAPEAYTSGHIVEAVSLPSKDVDEKYKKLEKFKSNPLVLVCATGLESQKAASILIKHGFNVFILAGGIRAWQTAEMPLVKG